MTASMKKLGYQGAGWINEVQVLMTAGGFNTQQTPAYMEPYNVNRDGYSRSKVHHADGVAMHTGNIAFDVTEASLSSLLTTSTLLSRGAIFPVEIYDGNVQEKMTSCMVNSLTISGSAEGLIGASMSFISNDGRSTGSLVPTFNRNVRDAATPYGPLAYWWAGYPGANIRSWSLMFTQTVTPVYLNLGSFNPLYLRYGKIAMTFNLTTYSEVLSAVSPIGVGVMPSKQFLIATKTFTIYGSTVEAGYNFGGQSDVGTYAHTFESAALEVSNATVLTAV